ncbi:MAG: 50S ribosomal protein L21 [Candidatus Omnitrophica bacterium]|nr:50S ribosomal protein L21 [Candidatus Omnitrophota bacterium]MBU1933055.1 50S ribosomal protein L21 [Candidatus Omnitrophota bacterium]
MYAIVETGSKQYKVSKGDVLAVELLDSKKTKEVKLGNVLFVSDKKEVKIGSPYIKGASVLCDIVEEKQGPKVISFKYRRRHGSSRRKKGHRQRYSVLKVKDIFLIS